MQIDEVELLGRAVDPTLRIPKFSLGRIEGATRYYDLVWVSEPNTTYRLRFSFDLKTWTNVSGGTGIPSGGAASHLELSSFDPAINFRIEKEP
ncbi:hypothetical protein N9A94_02620 [Akkermansiaceae bacterium]|nr:hypothetical protein [Akkermansiaceae bacterium]MDB4537108.1 hypothetical protein [Akkermansiaceae bacterium]